MKERGHFDTTRWSVVLEARDGRSDADNAALSWLCEAYWHPLYSYVRRRGHDPDEAAELTQAYFAVLLEKKYLKGVDPSLGKFRSFLLKSMQHFLANEWDRRHALKRGGHQTPVSLDRASAEDRYRNNLRGGETPERVFERQWAMALLDRTLRRIEDEAASNGRSSQFTQLKPFLSDPRPGRSYREVAESLGSSETAVKVAVHRLRKRFGVVLREEIRETVTDPAAVDAEIRHLFSVLES